MNYYCNPININYRYQFIVESDKSNPSIAREAADPTLICFKGRYYIFASMTLGVWVSDDLVHWENHRLSNELPLYDYAPDARVMGEYVYLSASKKKENCDFYRTKNILEGPFEKIKGCFPFWDPNLFIDDDGKMYFYWGCSNETPIWGVELTPSTMKPCCEKKILIEGNPYEKGFERFGIDNSELPRSEEEIEMYFQNFLLQMNVTEDQIPIDIIPVIKGMFTNKPFIEGVWMDKFKGKYYLQYACPGTELNVYSDAVYESEKTLGPFKLAKNNPYSHKPGGFIPGAGHGSTMKDLYGNLWHASTMRISVNHRFERRVGLWPAGIDEDGELFCNQRYGDWPMNIEDGVINPWRNPDWFLLSYKKQVYASSCMEGYGAEMAVDENVQTWWRAASANPGEWLLIDLEGIKEVHAIQINFADDEIHIPIPRALSGEQKDRHIETNDYYTRWILEGSVDGIHFEMIEDKSNAKTDLSHDFILLKGKKLRFLKLTIFEVPYQQPACISGMRVFGIGEGNKASVPEYKLTKTGETDMMIEIQPNQMDTIVGYNILWGTEPDKLYHSYMIFGLKQRIGALVKGQEYYVRVDAFNEVGITEGKVIQLKNI